MAAVDNLMARLRAINRSVDALSEPAFQEAEIRDHLIRGIAVNGLVSVEVFLRDRMEEWAASLMAARVPPSHLPGGTKQYEDRIVQVLPRALRDCDPAQRSGLLQAVGQSLTSLSTGTLVPHVLAFSWSGSNVQVEDIESLIALLGVDRNRVWNELTARWSKVDHQFPGNTNLKPIFTELADLRHNAAHNGAPNISMPNLSTVSRNVKLTCLCIDIVVWQGLRKIVAGPAGAAVAGRRTSVRKVIRDGGIWREYAPSATRATRIHNSLEDAMRESVGRAVRGEEVVLASDQSGELLDWRMPP
jgi:hypothetical protein